MMDGKLSKKLKINKIKLKKKTNPHSPKHKGLKRLSLNSGRCRHCRVRLVPGPVPGSWMAEASTAFSNADGRECQGGAAGASDSAPALPGDSRASGWIRMVFQLLSQAMKEEHWNKL